GGDTRGHEPKTARELEEENRRKDGRRLNRRSKDGIREKGREEGGQMEEGRAEEGKIKEGGRFIAPYIISEYGKSGYVEYYSHSLILFVGKFDTEPHGQHGPCKFNIDLLFQHIATRST
ncbi:MAG: hypothetical protein ACI3Y5_01120, partial [Prevotella sp.]